MAVAALVVSVVAGLAGSFMQSSALKDQARAQEQIGEYNAQEKQIQANREQAAGQLRASEQRREAERVAGVARAGLAQGGVDTSSGSALLLDSEIIKEGAFKANIEIADAANKTRTLEEGAKADRFEGRTRAASSRSQARASLLSGIGSAFSSAANFKYG